MRRILTPFLFVIATALPVSSFAAATLDDVVNAINRVYDLVAANFNLAMTTANDLIYEDNPNLPATATGNSTQSTASATVKSTTINSVLPFIQQDLTRATKNPEKELSYIPASDYYNTSGSYDIFSSPTPAPSGQGDLTFNMGSLVAPTVYNADQQVNANNFNRFIAFLNTPLTTINWSELSGNQKKTLQDDKNGQKYRATLRALVAARSVALDNLYSIYSERMPVANLGTQTGIPNVQDASAMQVQEYLATRRTNSQEWYDDMAQASPATIQREQLFVLAEMERQLYQLHRDNERIIATLSTLELLNTNITKTDVLMLEPTIKGLLGLPTGTTTPQMPMPAPAPASSSK